MYATLPQTETVYYIEAYGQIALQKERPWVEP